MYGGGDGTLIMDLVICLWHVFAERERGTGEDDLVIGEIAVRTLRSEGEQKRGLGEKRRHSQV